MQNIYKLKIMLIALLSTITMNLFSQLPNVLICGAQNYGVNNDVKEKLEATGQFNSVTIFNIYQRTPTLDYLSQFEAILVYTDYPASNPNLLGDILAAYIDGGGGVVSAVFETTTDGDIGGAFNSKKYRVILPGDKVFGPPQTLGNVLKPDHPIMDGITGLDGGIRSYRSTSTTLAPGGYRIADWSDGSFLITAKDNVGPSHVSRVDLGMFPPSKDVYIYSWLPSTDGALIMANSLTYVAFNPNKCAAPAKLSVPRIGDTAVLLKWRLPQVSAESFWIHYRSVGSVDYLGKWAYGEHNRVEIDGLSPNTTYEWRMRSNCNDDTSGWVRGPNFTTISSPSFSKTGAVNGNNTEEKASMQVIANPNKGNFTIQMHLPAKEASTTLALYNNLGEKVWQEDEGRLSGSFSKNISLENKLSTGVYLLSVERGDVRLQQKVVVIK